jgi:FKBP-type peptidyl-prolyl cis-trans isomerase FklB
MVILLMTSQAGLAAETEQANAPEPAKASEAATATTTDTAATAENPLPRTKKAWTSYSIGVETGRNITRKGVEVDPELVIRGLKDALTGAQIQLSDTDLMESLNALYTDVRVKQRKDWVATGLDNKAKGDAFLAANKAKEGVVTTPSGLQYKIIKTAKGKKPDAKSTVECNYRGTLIDGTEFADTYKEGQPALLKLSDANVIPGLKEALKLMPSGSKWQLFIPPYLAYLSHGAGSIIGPNETLVYEMELLSVK